MNTEHETLREALESLYWAWLNNNYSQTLIEFELDPYRKFFTEEEWQKILQGGA